MKTCKILFMGTPDIAVSMLDRILKDGYEVVGVVTQPDKKAGRKQQLKMPEVKVRALKEGLNIYQPMKIKDAVEELMQLDIDLIVTCAYGQFIPSKLLEYPTYGSINVHASLLPKLRGGAPIHKAIIHGDKQTGMSIMRMVKAMDAGAVMRQCIVDIEEDDTTGILYDKLAKAGAQLLSECIPDIISGNAVFHEQEEGEATFAYTIQKEEEYIDFSMPLQKVYDHIRGLIPFPIGYAKIDGKNMKFYQARKKVQQHAHTAGEIIGLMDGGFGVAVDGGYILLDELQLEGKAKCDAKSFYNGAGRNLIGKRFVYKDER